MSIAQTIPPASSLAPICMTPDSTKRSRGRRCQLAANQGTTRTPRTLALGVIGALLAASPLFAHHDWLVDQTKQVTIQGTVTAFTWANPHVMVALDVQADGTIDKWKIGGSSPPFMTTCGWDKKTLKPGDVITVIGYRFRDGSNGARMLTVLMPNGKEMFYGAPPSQAAQCVPPARVTPPKN